MPAVQDLNFDIASFTWLAACHGHVRDQRVQFEAEGHVYWIDGKSADFSVTSFIATFCEARGLQKEYCRYAECKDVVPVHVRSRNQYERNVIRFLACCG